jgi:hypothetical protein
MSSDVKYLAKQIRGMSYGDLKDVARQLAKIADDRSDGPNLFDATDHIALSDLLWDWAGDWLEQQPDEPRK